MRSPWLQEFYIGTQGDNAKRQQPLIFIIFSLIYLYLNHEFKDYHYSTSHDIYFFICSFLSNIIFITAAPLTFTTSSQEDARSCNAMSI